MDTKTSSEHSTFYRFFGWTYSLITREEWLRPRSLWASTSGKYLQNIQSVFALCFLVPRSASSGEADVWDTDMTHDYNSEMDIHFPKWRHSITRTRLDLPLPPLKQQSVIISLACWVEWGPGHRGGGGGGRKWMTNLCFSRNQEFWRGLIHPHLPPLDCPLLPIDCTPLSWGVYEWSGCYAPTPPAGVDWMHL